MDSQTPKTDQIEPLIEETIDVLAPREKVWSLVADLPRLAEWSPQVVRSFLRGGRPVRLGTRMVNINRRGLLVWPTQAKVVRFEVGQEVAFKIRENHSIWSFSLDTVDSDAGTTTRIVQRREAPEGVTELSRRLTDKVLGGQSIFQAELRAGMKQTLSRIKAEAERA